MAWEGMFSSMSQSHLWEAMSNGPTVTTCLQESNPNRQNITSLLTSASSTPENELKSNPNLRQQAELLASEVQFWLSNAKCWQNRFKGETRLLEKLSQMRELVREVDL